MPWTTSPAAQTASASSMAPNAPAPACPPPAQPAQASARHSHVRLFMSDAVSPVVGPVATDLLRRDGPLVLHVARRLVVEHDVDVVVGALHDRQIAPILLARVVVRRA